MLKLENFSSADFLREHWQQSPCLITGALPDWGSALTGAELAGLAMEEDVESRLVLYDRRNSDWQVEHGPFEAQTFQSLPDTDWTLLVQAVDLWSHDVDAIKSLFDFLPNWRLDDIMVSYAVAGGTVGPHFDHYDVFLLQAEGQRCWQIGSQCDASTPMVANAPLKLLSEFTPKEEYLLNPGDMLYLPPGYAHYGVAKDSCQTYSIGFRSPTLGDLLADLASETLSKPTDSVYRDPPSSNWQGEKITEAHIDQIQTMLKTLAHDRQSLAHWFARFVTQPRYEPGTTPLIEQRTAIVGNQEFVNGRKAPKPGTRA